MLGIKGLLLDVEVRPEAAVKWLLRAATSMAFRECMTDLTKREQTQLLEPIMKLEVSGPDEYIGNVVGDLNSRRGRIQSISVKPGGGQIILAQVPLAGLFGYSTDVRSLSQVGQASVLNFRSTKLFLPR
jgi:elongation factor G